MDIELNSNAVEQLTYEKYVEVRKALYDLIPEQGEKTAQQGYIAFLAMVMKFPQNFGFKGQFQAAKAIRAYDKKYNKELKESKK